jgi:hypothetical protein
VAGVLKLLGTDPPDSCEEFIPDLKFDSSESELPEPPEPNRIHLLEILFQECRVLYSISQLPLFMVLESMAHAAQELSAVAFGVLYNGDRTSVVASDGDSLDDWKECPFALENANDAEDLALAFDLDTDISVPVPDFSAKDLAQLAEPNTVTSAVDADGSNALEQEIRKG